MTREKNKAKRDLKRMIIKVKFTLADATQQLESLAIDDVLIETVHEKLLIAFTYIDCAYDLARKND